MKQLLLKMLYLREPAADRSTVKGSKVKARCQCGRPVLSLVVPDSHGLAFAKRFVALLVARGALNAACHICGTSIDGLIYTSTAKEYDPATYVDQATTDCLAAQDADPAAN